jgi:hypothetical protein
MRRTADAVSSGLLTVLFEKHITSCDNVFLTQHFLLATNGLYYKRVHCHLSVTFHSTFLAVKNVRTLGKK